ncbi:MULTISPECIES: threonine-phosphate decarboxylase CobD [unclassified Candidatus Paralachnospira]|uniref:threonine-phosphate decarboxylase CobD n=1 Tax=unclassified Candidatus Paralachnospira TaxID=3099471 RepID=UPI003F8FCFC5
MKHTHGGNIYPYDHILDFSANLNPLGMPGPVRIAAMDAVIRSDYYPDPDCTALKEAISRREQVSADQIICGCGAAEIIYLVFQALRPCRVLLISPSFAEYEEAACATDSELCYYETGPELTIKEDYLDALGGGIDVAFLCNPNNPTGLTCSREFLMRVLEKCRESKTLLVLDECFLDFLPDKEAYEMTGELEGGSLLILKAFTKSYAMPGLRLGYGMTADRELLMRMEEVRQPWSVSVPAQAAGVAALEEVDPKFLEETVRVVTKERKRLEEGLKRFGFAVFPGKANYLFFRSCRTDLKEALLKRGILIRDCSNYRHLKPGDYRIAVRTEAENTRLLEALKSEMEDTSWQKR